MTDRCCIFAGGDAVSESCLDKEFISSALIIAADRGHLLAKSLGIDADVCIGDFDSSQKPVTGNIRCYPPEKDDTDLMLAVKLGLEKGCKLFQIYGAFGGSVDHLFGNIQSLAYLTENDAQGVMIGDNDTIRLVRPGIYTENERVGWSLSLFAYGGDVEGLGISGAKYNADNIRLTDSFPLGVSNTVLSENGAFISFRSGRLMIIRSRRD